eukprot:scaffold501_cov407-Prasinococcus_capsulatus_cf.AAC.2
MSLARCQRHCLPSVLRPCPGMPRQQTPERTNEMTLRTSDAVYCNRAPNRAMTSSFCRILRKHSLALDVLAALPSHWFGCCARSWAKALLQEKASLKFSANSSLFRHQSCFQADNVTRT